MNQELILWIQDQLKRGVAPNKIWQSLNQRGFDSSDLMQAFSYVQNQRQEALQYQSNPKLLQLGIHHPLLVLPALFSILILVFGAYFFMSNSSPLEGPELKFSSKKVSEQSVSEIAANEQESSKEKILAPKEPKSTDEDDERGEQQSCGDNHADDFEACDGWDLKEQSCQTKGFLRGRLGCSDDCSAFDLSKCSSEPLYRCGNGMKDIEEVCDGEDISSQTCLIFSFSSGTLACKADCTGFDTSQCIVNQICQNNVKEGNEACDGADLDGQSCQSKGLGSGTLSCQSNCLSLDTSQCSQGLICGNNAKEGTEVCDGYDLGGKTCAAQGFDSGTLYCNSDCTLDTSSCETYVCANNLVEGSEVCDGTNVGFKSCQTQGFSSGTLKCKADCSGYDTSLCVSSQNCPNNVRESSEVCDGIDLAGQTCSSKGFTSGILACKSDCKSFDTSGCAKCANNAKEGSEACDGNDLAGKTCLTQTTYSGTLKCRSDCSGFDISSCTIQSCGNSIVEGIELCDSSNLNQKTCQSFGFSGGTLKCQFGCDGFDTSSCTGSTSCGDNEINQNEYCDGTALNGQTCTSIGYLSGTLKCQSDCKVFDTKSCVISNSCGNNQIEGQETCDGTNLQGLNCVSINQYAGTEFTSGILKCQTNCDDFDVLGCS